MGRLLVSCVAVLVAAFPAAAHAGTAEAPTIQCVRAPCPAIVTYTDNPRHQADVVVTSQLQVPDLHTLVRFRERTGTVTAGDGCSQVDEQEAVCEIPNADDPVIRVLGGDQADNLAAGSPAAFGVQVDGGGGDDVLRGSRLDDTLVAGPGQDYVYGDAGDDLLVDGGAGPETDQLRGGPGLDTVSYEGRPDDITVDLHEWTGGAPGENDLVSGNENAQGGIGNDTLLGSSRPNTLRGGNGDDTIDGRRGDDVLRSGQGGDAVRCGVGDDLVGEATVRDIVEPDCERVRLKYTAKEIWPRVPAVAGRPVATLHGLSCGGSPCRTKMRVRVSYGEQRVAPLTELGVSVQRGDRPRPSVRLSRAGQRIVRRYPGLLVRITYGVHRGTSTLERGGFTTRLTLRG
jgi:Ca2+-binding RTX toxin-like protein